MPWGRVSDKNRFRGDLGRFGGYRENWRQGSGALTSCRQDGLAIRPARCGVDDIRNGNGGGSHHQDVTVLDLDGAHRPVRVLARFVKPDAPGEGVHLQLAQGGSHGVLLQGAGRLDAHGRAIRLAGPVFIHSRCHRHRPLTAATSCANDHTAPCHTTACRSPTSAGLPLSQLMRPGPRPGSSVPVPLPCRHR